jgi:hypothetical protein
VISRSCHHGVMRPQVADGGTASNMGVVTNKLTKKSWTAHKGWSSRLGVGNTEVCNLREQNELEVWKQ